jgi:hypothetical protein
MKKLILFCFLFAGITFAAKAQFAPDTDTLSNFPYVCQADSFTVTISGLHYMGGHTLDSVSHVFRNDSLVINIYYTWVSGTASFSNFYLPLRFGTPQPALYTIYSKRFTNLYFEGQGTSSIGVCTTVSGLKNETPQEISARIFPNPTQNLLNLEIPERVLAVSVQLTDLTGKTILSKDLKTADQKQLNLENLKPGIYLLILQCEKGKTVRRIIKN